MTELVLNMDANRFVQAGVDKQQLTTKRVRAWIIAAMVKKHGYPIQWSYRNGYGLTVQDLIAVSPLDIFATKNCGPKTIAQIALYLEMYGLRLAHNLHTHKIADEIVTHTKKIRRQRLLNLFQAEGSAR